MEADILRIIILMTVIWSSTATERKNVTTDFTKIPDPVRVTTIQMKPFLYVNGHDKTYHGYIIDLLEILSGMIGFNYTINEVNDQNWGEFYNETEWTGMVGELSSGKSDLAAAPLTMTRQREDVVDFTMPFMTHGIAIIMNKNDVFPKDPHVLRNLAFFLMPLTGGVWMSTIVLATLVGIMLALNNHFNPYELSQRQQRGEDVPKDAHQTFALAQALWFSFTSLFLQAFAVRPRSFAGRVLMAFWWFYCLVFVCTYIGAMIKTVPFIAPSVPQVAKFRSLEDLVHQNEVNYGVIKSGAIREFFEKSDVPLYRLIAENWTFVDTSDDGFHRMHLGGYAFITDSVMIDYKRSFNCDYLSVGELLDTKFYAFAVPHGSPLREILNQGLLSLAENGYMDLLYHNHFQQNFTYSTYGTSYFEHICEGTKISRQTYTPRGRPASDPYFHHQVGLDVFGGPIIVMVVGIIATALTLISEKMFFKLKGKPISGIRSLRNRDSPYDETTTEIVPNMNS